MEPCNRKWICAVIVTWNIGKEFTKNLDSVINQVERVIIVDNGSDAATATMLNDIVRIRPGNVVLICNERNLGIGAAQNQGVKAAIAMGFEWILLLDHDSTPAGDMVACLMDGYTLLKNGGGTGLLAPYIEEKKMQREMSFFPRKGCFLRKFGKESVTTDVQAVISSGSMIKKELFETIGLFREDMFIDYVDTEFCMRMKKHGWEIALVKRAVLYHNIGDLAEHTLAGRRTGATNHSPSRRFTIFKNRVGIWKEYFHVAPLYILFDMAMAVYDLLKIAMFETSRKKKIKAAFKGLAAGIC